MSRARTARCELRGAIHVIRVTTAIPPEIDADDMLSFTSQDEYNIAEATGLLLTA